MYFLWSCKGVTTGGVKDIKCVVSLLITGLIRSTLVGIFIRISKLNTKDINLKDAV